MDKYTFSAIQKDATNPGKEFPSDAYMLQLEQESFVRHSVNSLGEVGKHYA